MEATPVVCPSCKWSWKTKGRRIKIMCPNCKKDHDRAELTLVKIIKDKEENKMEWEE